MDPLVSAVAAGESNPDDACCFCSWRSSHHLRAGILGSMPRTTAASFASSPPPPEASPAVAQRLFVLRQPR